MAVDNAATLAHGRLFRGRLAVATLAGCLAACTGFLPEPAADAPGPTRLEPAGRSQVEVVWDNRSDEAFVVSIAGVQPDQRAFALVEPCSAHNVIQFADAPFEIGLGQRDVFVAEPMPIIVHSRELGGAPQERYRVHITIDPDGSVSTQPLAGTAPWEPRQGIC